VWSVRLKPLMLV